MGLKQCCTWVVKPQTLNISFHARMGRHNWEEHFSGIESIFQIQKRNTIGQKGKTQKS